MYVFFLLGRKATGAMRCIFKIVFFPRPTEYFDDTVSMDYLLPVASVKFLDKSAGATKQRGPETRQRLRLSLYWYGGFSQKNETRDKQNLVKKNRKPRKKPIIYMENLKKRIRKFATCWLPLYKMSRNSRFWKWQVVLWDPIERP